MEEEVWAELESRAGASDQDRKAWLAERRRGITATEVRDLAKAGDLNNAIANLVRQKITGVDTFGGNSYTAWGNEREPLIATFAEQEYGFRPESRVFRHPEFPEWLASPDGIRVRPFDLGLSLLEIKTAGYPLTYEGCLAKGYIDQTQWQMLVLGADETLLMWEERIEGERGWEAGRRGVIPIEADEERQEQLAAIADRFLEAYREARAEGLPDTSDDDPLLAALISDVVEKRRAAEVAEEYLRDYLDLSEITAAATPVGKLSYTWGKPRRSFNREAFDEQYPGVYEMFMEDGKQPERQTLRITPAKDA